MKIFHLIPVSTLRTTAIKIVISKPVHGLTVSGLDLYEEIRALFSKQHYCTAKHGNEGIILRCSSPTQAS